MQTYTDIVNFVTAQSRAIGSDITTLLPYWINESYQRIYNRNPAGWPSQRATGTFTTTSAQNYSLPTNFRNLIENSVLYYESTNEDGPYQTLEIVRGDDGEIWEQFETQLDPVACRIISGADGNRRLLRLLPAFTNTDRLITYAYQRKPNQSLSSTTILDVPELASAVAWDVLATNKQYFRDTKNMTSQFYITQREEAYKTALRTTLQ